MLNWVYEKNILLYISIHHLDFVIIKIVIITLVIKKNINSTMGRLKRYFFIYYIKEVFNSILLTRHIIYFIHVHTPSTYVILII